MTQAVTTPPRHAPAPGPLPAHVRVAVVGSGFSGIGTAVALRREGIDDLVVLQRTPPWVTPRQDRAYNARLQDELTGTVRNAGGYELRAARRVPVPVPA